MNSGFNNREPITVSQGAAHVAVTAFGAMLVLSGPAWLAAGTTGLISVAASAAICVIPGIVIIALVGLQVVRSPLGGLLTSMSVRMGTALLAVYFVRESRPDLSFVDFYLWLAVMYCVTLVAETRCLTRAPLSVNRAGT